MQKRYLVLAEGRSGDPHYGKTARGVIRYAPEKVVAVLDSQRAGESYEGFPIVGTVEEAMPLEPTTALVGVATSGGRFPPEWREILKECLRAGLDIENGLHQRVSEDPELVELAGAGGARLIDLRKPPDDLNVPTGARCGGTAAGDLVRFRSDRTDGDRDRWLGNRRRRSDRGLHRRLGRATRARGRRAWR